MKSLKLTLFTLILIAYQVSMATSQATYYRVWQGYKRDDLTKNQFINALPTFMKMAAPLYGPALNDYIVAIPVDYVPSVIPDEFALLALTSEHEYQNIRATAEGQAYGEAHWDLFAKDYSKSAPLTTTIPDALEIGVAYDMIGAPVNWSGGYTSFFLGARRAEISVEDFKMQMAEHLKLVAEHFRPIGLKGYIAIIGEDYEAAYLNWESEDSANKAFASAAGHAVRADAEEIMEFVQFTSVKPFNGTNVIPGESYSLIRR